MHELVFAVFFYHILILFMFLIETIVKFYC